MRFHVYPDRDGDDQRDLDDLEPPDDVFIDDDGDDDQVDEDLDDELADLDLEDDDEDEEPPR